MVDPGASFLEPINLANAKPSRSFNVKDTIARRIGSDRQRCEMLIPRKINQQQRTPKLKRERLLQILG